MHTTSGREFVLGGETGYHTPRIVELHSATHTCTDLADVTHNPIASASHINWGMAWLSKPGSGLLLSTVDTSGFYISLNGTVYWPSEEWEIIDADLAISDAGHVVVCWKEYSLTQPNVARIQIARVNWWTELSSEDPFSPSPLSLSLSSFPNPFNSELQIRYELPRSEFVELAVYNVLGQQVASLITGVQRAGAHQAVWSPQEGSGIYFVSLRTEHNVRTQKVLLAR
jgi:hypothetical protein